MSNSLRPDAVPGKVRLQAGIGFTTPGPIPISSQCFLGISEEFPAVLQPLVAANQKTSHRDFEMWYELRESETTGYGNEARWEAYGISMGENGQR
jgi:hypothetical protein